MVWGSCLGATFTDTPTRASSDTYYVDAINGSDANVGTSEALAWKTISKVNKSSFNPGERILLKRGLVWRERLNIPSGGQAGNPIVFDAYGSGMKPKLLGSIDRSATSDWTQDIGNIWKTTGKIGTDVGNLVFK